MSRWLDAGNLTPKGKRNTYFVFFETFNVYYISNNSIRTPLLLFTIIEKLIKINEIFSAFLVDK